MASIKITAPRTITQVLSVAYLASEYEITSARGVEIWTDDETKDFTIRYRMGQDADNIERVVVAALAGNQAPSAWIAGTGAPGVSLFLNIKSGAGTPNAKIFIW